MNPLTITARALIGAYQWGISPFLAPRCRYLPTCSEYAREALQVHGLVPGGTLALRRLCRCHPWGGDGFDPVPPPASTRTEGRDSPRPQLCPSPGHDGTN